MIDLKQHMNLLGMQVKDRVTGFSGIVTGICFDLYGCIQATVHPGIVDGKLGDQLWFDVARLKVINDAPVMDPPQFDWSAAEVARGKKGPNEKSNYNKN